MMVRALGVEVSVGAAGDLRVSFMCQLVRCDTPEGHAGQCPNCHHWEVQSVHWATSLSLTWATGTWGWRDTIPTGLLSNCTLFGLL